MFESAVRRLSDWGMPWLLSSSVHLGLLLLLAFTWHLTNEPNGGAGQWSGLSTGISLSAVASGPRGDRRSPRPDVR